MRIRIRLGAFGFVGLLGLGLFVAGKPESGAAQGGFENPFFWTWDKLEPDTVASAWLLRRFAAPGCEIRFLADRGRSQKGIAFDVPLTDLTRDRTRSSFHVIRERYGLKDPALERLERWIDEIEIGGWDREPSSEAAALDRRLREVISQAPSPEDALRSTGPILDELYRISASAQEGKQ